MFKMRIIYNDYNRKGIEQSVYCSYSNLVGILLFSLTTDLKGFFIRRVLIVDLHLRHAILGL
ncbi:hypothetical protein GCM10008929_09190 [Alkalibacterium psychrotolerans]